MPGSDLTTREALPPLRGATSVRGLDIGWGTPELAPNVGIEDMTQLVEAAMEQNLDAGFIRPPPRPGSVQRGRLVLVSVRRASAAKRSKPIRGGEGATIR